MPLYEITYQRERTIIFSFVLANNDEEVLAQMPNLAHSIGVDSDQGVSFRSSTLENPIQQCVNCSKFMFRIQPTHIMLVMGHRSETYLCPTCQETHTFCHYCSHITEKNPARQDSRGEYACPRCTIRLCPNCSAFCNSLEEGCAECREHIRGRHIHGHGWKQQLVFFPDAQQPFYMGFELEVDGFTDSKLSRCSKSLYDAHKEQYYHQQTDGSLHNGIEIVTLPATLDYHAHTMPWQSVVDIIKENGGEGDQSNSAGLHVHFNRTFLDGKTSAITDENTIKLLHLYEKFRQQLTKFSRRTDDGMHWTRFYDMPFKPDTPEGKSQYIVLKNNLGRYHCVNLTNRSTIEIRLFRSTTSYSTLLASLELVDYLAFVAKNTSPTELVQWGWVNFLKDLDDKKYPNLRPYLSTLQLATLPIKEKK